MKKLIAISVMFALIAGAAFAVDLGATVFGTADLFGANGGGDPEFLNNGGNGRIRLEGSGEEEIGIGKVGGWLRLDAGASTSVGFGFDADAYADDYAAWIAAGSIPADEPNEFDYIGLTASTSQDTFGLAWWQPIDAVRIQIGVNPDGHYDTSHIGRYGFYAQANEINGLVTADGNWGPLSYDTGVFGGYGSLHLGVIITPMDALTINIALPLNQGPQGTDKQMASVFKNTLFQVNYSAGFGAIHVTYQGTGGSTGGIWGSVFLSMIENLGIEVGVGYTLVESGAPKEPVGIALGVTYDAGAFGAKLRAIIAVPMESGGDLGFRVDILPYYAVNDNVTILGDIGILMADSDNMIWHFAPYVRIGSTWGSGFYAGLRFSNGSPYSTAKEDDVNWAIPVGIIVKF